MNSFVKGITKGDDWLFSSPIKTMMMVMMMMMMWSRIRIIRIFLRGILVAIDFKKLSIHVSIWCNRGSAKKALRIIYPEAWSYTEAQEIANISRLWKRTDELCFKCLDKMKSKGHPLHFLLPRPLINQPERNLRKNADTIYLFNEFISCRTKRVEN